MCYAQKYHDVLETGDAYPLVNLSSGPVRRHAMEALTAYAKFSGCYEKWCEIRKRHSLRWTNGNESLQALQRFFNPDLSLDVMLDKIRNMLQVLPKPMAAVVRHALLTGLRPAEAVESVRLLVTKTPGYYDPAQQALLHYKFPQFQRTTKRAYISYLSVDNLQPITVLDCQTPTWSAIRSMCKRRGLSMDMRYCRKVHGTWLYKYGEVSEAEVDFLHGRTSPSIFSRHYLTSDSTLRTRVLRALRKIDRHISK
jgi:Archaeal phage integrase